MSMIELSTDKVTVLFKGGRLPEWEALSAETRRAYEQEHVDLMLSVAQEHQMMRLEGFKLLAPQGSWKTTWIIEFPTLAGAEAWIGAEMAPPYGRYGYYEYYLARPYGGDRASGWVTRSRPASSPSAGADPHRIPPLAVDRSSYVGLLFERRLPEWAEATAAQRGDSEQIDLMGLVARQHGLMCLEAFQLMAPQPDWHRLWVIELPTIEGLEAWIAGETAAPHSRYSLKSFHLARRWAPEYFVTWISG